MITKAGQEAWRTMFDLFLAGDLPERVGRVSKAVDLAPGLLKALVYLSLHDDARMRDLADQWSCDASYITTVIDGLEERGLAKREPHPIDRRVKTVVLTAKGITVKERAFELLYEPPKAFAALNSAEQRELRHLLLKLADAQLAAAS